MKKKDDKKVKEQTQETSKDAVNDPRKAGASEKDAPESTPSDFPEPDPGFYGDFPPGMVNPHGGFGFGPPQPSSLPDDREKELAAKKELSQEELFEWLKPVEDPELFLSVVELGLVYTVELKDGKEIIEMTLTSPGCPAGDYILGSIQQRAEMHPLVESAEVKLVWEPKWDPHEMASEEAKDTLGIW